MKISFLVPAFNEAKVLDKFFTNLNPHCQILQAQGLQTEIIVCDNNSSDTTAEIARAQGAQVVFEGINQIARARNAAAAIATGDWLIFVDADTWPSLQLIHETLNRINSSQYLGGGAVITLDHFTWESRIIVFLWNCISRIFNLAAGSFTFIERKSFIKIGGFGYAHFAGEELDMVVRAKKLAKEENRKWGIISKLPVLTSARKFDLYSFKERVVQFFKLLRAVGRPYRREHCEIWYDGRR